MLGPWNRRYSYLIGGIQYILALSSLTNVLVLVVELGSKSILNWGCTKSWPPILWALIPLYIHGLAAIGYKLSRTGPSQHRKPSLVRTGKLKWKVTEAEIPLNGDEHNDMTQSTPFIRRLSQSTISSIIYEMTPSASHQSMARIGEHGDTQPDTKAVVAVMLNCFAGFLGFVHLLYGTILFSSLLFIHAIDAISVVVLRFLVTALICRTIVLVEIAGIRSMRNGVVKEQAKESGR